jgi:hypothetical protein
MVPFSRRTTNPRVLSKPTPASYRIGETECLTNTDSDETPLDSASSFYLTVSVELWRPGSLPNTLACTAKSNAEGQPSQS